MNATKNRIAIQEYKHNGQFVAGTNTDEHLYAFDRQALEQAVRAVNSFDAMHEALEVMKDEKEILAEKLAKLEKELAFYKAKNGDAGVCHACDETGWVYG